LIVTQQLSATCLQVDCRLSTINCEEQNCPSLLKSSWCRAFAAPSGQFWSHGLCRLRLPSYLPPFGLLLPIAFAAFAFFPSGLPTFSLHAGRPICVDLLSPFGRSFFGEIGVGELDEALDGCTVVGPGGLDLVVISLVSVICPACLLRPRSGCRANGSRLGNSSTLSGPSGSSRETLRCMS